MLAETTTLPRAITQPLGEPPGFKSSKTNGIGIRYRPRWTLNGLLQANFDPRIELIAACDLGRDLDVALAFTVAGPSLEATLILVEDDFRGDLSNFPGVRNAVLVHKFRVTVEPVAGAARTVWARHHHDVPPVSRLRVLTMLNASSQGLSLAQLTNAPDATPAMNLDDVFRLACDGEIHLDLSAGLIPEARVWRAGAAIRNGLLPQA